MTTASAREVGRAPARQELEAGPQAQTGARARESSLSPVPTLPPEGTGPLVTGSDRNGWLTRAAGASARTRDAARKVVSGPPVLHAGPSSVARMRQRHRESAARYEAGLLRWPRAAWGAGHTAAYAVFLAFFETVFSPAGAFVLAVIVVVFLIWS